MLLRVWTVFACMCLCRGQDNKERVLIEEQNVLSPPYFNIATGKKIDTTSTCGTEGRELFCKLTGGTNFEFSSTLHQGQVCDICDASVPEKSHPVNNAIDGTEKWWQSPPLSRGSEYNHVNVTIHLGQVFHVAYVLVKFANSPRAGTWVLERSSDNGKTFQPWQYFANTDSDCYNQFGMSSLEEITRDDSVICTSEYSGAVPLENGEVIVSMIKGRPGAHNFSYATVLQEWSKATDIRLRLLRTKTLLGHLMAVSEQDPTVTRRYYYSVKDISIGGRCVCNGHADTCQPDPFDQYKLKCQCQHNTCGDSCERCCEGFVQKAWRVAVPESTNECEACNCHGHSNQCVYDEEVARRRLSLDLYGNYEGGGVCQNCQHNTAGVNCEQCASGYWRPDDVDPHDPNGCRACDCDSSYTIGSCEPNTGRCYCRVQYAGDRCDRCAPGYHDFPECRPCDCYYNGTLDEVCQPVDDSCPCKYNFAGMYCEECAPGFFNFPQCDACECTGEGVASDVCDPYTGYCPCSEGFTGEHCSECAPGYFSYPLCRRCPCSDVGTTDQVCDSMTGECFCGDKFSGRSCDDCKEGYYGFPQCIECQCAQPGSLNNHCDSGSGRCLCQPNYAGERCDQCSPEFYGYPSCVSCDCNRRGSLRTTCDQQSGQCICRENIGGRSCDMCNSNYFNFPRCEECSCDTRGIVPTTPGVCLAFTTGQCECRENVTGNNCDMCIPLHYDLDRGCVDCNCFLPGTLDGVGECDGESGSCWCKPYTCSQRCSQCEDGFFSLQHLNYFGCQSCQCDVGGAMTSHCDKNTGQCRCRSNVGGRRCDRPLNDFFHPTLYQYQYELEYSRSPQGGPVRTGYNDSIFNDYNMNGYVQFSTIQPTIVISVDIAKGGLYRIAFRYVNKGSSSKANATLSPYDAGDDSAIQTVDVIFPTSSRPRVSNGLQPLVLSRGRWQLWLTAPPGVLVDYAVLIPSQYYEPSILDLTITNPCSPTSGVTTEQCVMFSHPDLSSFTTVDLVADAPRSQRDFPSTAHPEMRFLNSVSQNVDDGKFTADVTLPSPGKFVLVLEYASSGNKFQQAKVYVNSASSNSQTGKFNIYSCLYSFLCRQVALGAMNEVAVFESSVPDIKVHVRTESGGAFYVKSLTAIPYEEWKMELVDPKPRCTTVEGPEFDRCLVSSYNFPAGSSRFPAASVDGEGDDNNPLPPTAEEFPLAYIDGNSGSTESTLQIPMELPPGRYVFVVHYFNPDHTSFTPQVVIDGGVTSTGGLNVTYCPNENGCLGVVSTDTGRSVIDITVPSSTFTIVGPAGKRFWIKDVYAIPENQYNPSVLEFIPSDKSSDFVRECSRENFHASTEEPSEFCRDSVFSLTVDYNNGAFSCNCSGAGTVEGREESCQEYGGQCHCKPNVIGRQCDRCRSGHFNFPLCQPCDCGDKWCDQITGECICPPNTIPPECQICAPFTHSFHGLLGCVECDCDEEGVVAGSRGCDADGGQCRCRENVTGQRCDRCVTGYFGFPDCRQCTCDPRGSASDFCNTTTGQCLCKENVEGLQCDRCRAGSIHLDAENPRGCTECFCFGAKVPAECHGSQYPATEVFNMDGWRVLNLRSAEVVSLNEESVRVDVSVSGGLEHPSSHIYWAAPEDYLEDKVGSYGGELSYSVNWVTPTGGRGDEEATEISPEPILGAASDVVLMGNQFTIGWTNPQTSKDVRLMLKEDNFQHISSGNDVKREEMMMVLADLQSLHIRAAPTNDVTRITLNNVVMTTTDYSLPIGSAPGIPTVEVCNCPEGYTGHSCQYCDVGYYREVRGPYLGYCKKCDCYGHCDVCDNTGQPIKSGDCLHNTGGDNCDVCKDGYIGNATSGEVEACTPCPCPNPSVDGNFANTCEMGDNDEVICYCKVGYTGDSCEQCAPGYFGNPTAVGGSCQPCNCHGNLDPNLIMEDCDPNTGKCTDCVYNTGGRYCERCADGFYGDAIVAKNCTECECNSCGTDECDHEQGFCSCKPHVIGRSCSTCEPGFFGFQSCRGCSSCSCAEGAITNECDRDNGQCQCAPNIIGIRCDKCAPGYWNYSPSGCEPCNCHNHGRCNPVNGLCECPPGVTGAQCDQCELARHVLEPGASECSRCDSCIDDLLDEIEPMTEAVKAAELRLRNTSIGVAATKRLNDLESRAQELKEVVDEDEEFLSGASMLVSEEHDGNEADMSGSSGDEEPIEDEGKLRKLENTIIETETAVSRMCNHTSDLFYQVQVSNVRSGGASNHSSELRSKADDFQEETNDLLHKLQMESSGDSDDFNLKLNQAEMIINRMKQRNMTSLQNTANVELEAATQLLEQIGEMFTKPAANISARSEKLIEKYLTIHKKLHDLRGKLNNATNLGNEATTMNAVNAKNLARLKEQIKELDRDVSAAGSDIDDSKTLLTTTRNLVNGPISDGINEVETLGGAVQQSVNDLRPVANLLQEDLDQYSPYVNQSLAKAAELEENARLLEELAQTQSGSSVEVSNRYQEIVILMKKAEDAADSAVLAAQKARSNVTNRNLQGEANAAASRSETLLSATQDLQDNEMASLNEDIQNVTDQLDSIEEGKNAISDAVDSLKQRVSGLRLGNISDQIEHVNDVVSRANAASRNASSEADKLEMLMRDAPGSGDFQRDLADVENTLDEVTDSVDRMRTLSSEVTQRAGNLASLQRSLNLRSQMINIRKRIELARNVANMIKDSMNFASDEQSGARHVQLRVPSAVQDIDKYIEVKFAVNIQKSSPDSQLLYYGDGTESGDFISIDTRGGFVRYTFKVGDDIGHLQSAVKVNNSQWVAITAIRWNNRGKLIVYYFHESRGDAAGGSWTDDEQTGDTGGSEIVSSIRRNDSTLVMGNLQLPQPPAGVGESGVGNLCISDVLVNNETIGVWNFVSYQGVQPGTSCQSNDSPYESNEAWRFQGQGSYARIRREDTYNFLAPTGKVHFIGFRLKTLQDNSLVALVGNSIDQFIAVQVINGDLIFHWNINNPSGPRNATIIADITQKPNPPSIKVGFQTARKKVVATASVNYMVREDYEGEVNLEGDIWLGGVWPYEINAELRNYLQNMDVSLRGCMEDLNVNTRTLDLQNAIENIGVTRGCRRESVQSLTMQGSDYARLAPDLTSLANVRGGFSMRSNTPTGTMMKAEEDQNSESDVIPAAAAAPRSGGFVRNYAPLPQDDAPLPQDDGNDENVASDSTGEDNPVSDSDVPPAESARRTGEREAQIQSKSGNTLPVILIVIGVVVAVVLIGAIISTIVKSRAALPPSGGSGFVPEQAPLNDVQSPRLAQMEW